MTGGNFYITPVYGFRTWQLDPAQGQLVALVTKAAWPRGRPLLSRHLAAHTVHTPRVSAPCVPGEPCRSCGIYAFEFYDQVQNHQWAGIGNLNLDKVRGVVAGWGRVTLCTKGWRAGKAYPLALLDWETPPERYGPEGIRWHTLLHLIAGCYEIPVVGTVNELVEVAESVGAVSLSEWRGEE